MLLSSVELSIQEMLHVLWFGILKMRLQSFCDLSVNLWQWTEYIFWIILSLSLPFQKIIHHTIQTRNPGMIWLTYAVSMLLSTVAYSNDLNRFTGLSISVHLNHVDDPSILFSNDVHAMTFISMVSVSKCRISSI